MKRKKKIPKKIIYSVIVAAIIAVTVAAVLITNVFIPVKYLTAYFVSRNKKECADDMRIVFIDVGYGDSTLVQLPDGKNMLIDAGDGRYSARRDVLKALNRYGADKIDYLVCSSVSSIRCAGLAEIMRYKSVGTVYMPYCLTTNINDGYRSFYRAAEGKERIISEYGVGVHEREYGYYFYFLSPTAHGLEGEDSEYYMLNAKPTTANINNASAVMYLSYSGASVALLGDISGYKLKKLADSYLTLGGFDVSSGGEKLTLRLEETQIVKVANHGYEGSACAAFYDLLSPETAILSVGENGRGCPSAQVLSDVQRHTGDKLYRTDLDGDIIVTIHADGSYSVKSNR